MFEEKRNVETGAGPSSGFVGLLLAEWPFIALYFAVLAGVVVVLWAPESGRDFWQVLIVFFALMALVMGWRDGSLKQQGAAPFVARTLVHWLALLALVRVLYLPTFDQVFNTEAITELMIQLLAFSTFLAGLYGNRKLLVLGVFIALSGIGIAMLSDTIVALAIEIVALAILAMAVTLVWRKFQQ